MELRKIKLLHKWNHSRSTRKECNSQLTLIFTQAFILFVSALPFENTFSSLVDTHMNKDSCMWREIILYKHRMWQNVT